jgi:hypothetical protein
VTEDTGLWRVVAIKGTAPEILAASLLEEWCWYKYSVASSGGRRLVDKGQLSGGRTLEVLTGVSH